MNVPKSTNKSFFFIVAGITLLAIPLTVFLLQNQTFLRQFASGAQQSATSSCNSSTGTAVINVSFTNTDGAKDMIVVAKDLQSGKSVSLGTVPHGQTATGNIDTGQPSLSANGITFTYTWADNSPGSDTRIASYNLVNTCSAPTSSNFCPVGGNNNQGLCSWDPLDGAQGYQVTVKETDSGKVVQQVSLPQTASNSAFPMTPGISYTCSIAGTNAGGVGTVTASPAKTCPGTPTPTPNACPASGLPLGYCRWDADYNATSYQVSVTNVTSGQLVKSDTVTAPTTEYAFPDDPAQTYQCNVSAVDVCTTSTPPTSSLPTTCTAPSATPTPTVAPSPTPTPTSVPSPTPTPLPTATPLPTPTPAVVIQTITSPPQVVVQPGTQTVIQQPGTQTIIQQPGKQTVVIPQPPVKGTTPQPTMPPTGSTTGTYAMVGASTLLLIIGGLVFFIL